MATDYPHRHLLGEDIDRDLGKRQWQALVVDLLRSTMGDAVDGGAMRAEVVRRMDALHAAGIVPRTLPYSRYPRDDRQ